MNCTICGLSADNVEDLVAENWTLSFFDGNEEHGPLCPACSEILLHIASDGEYELKREYHGKVTFNDQIEILEVDPLCDIVLGYILN
jgi:hypothetical protein